jgi:hypothetical protein
LTDLRGLAAGEAGDDRDELRRVDRLREVLLKADRE